VKKPTRTETNGDSKATVLEDVQQQEEVNETGLVESKDMPQRNVRAHFPTFMNRRQRIEIPTARQNLKK
jgi:hypothetical protein